jgi:transcriptional regulator GlxA family with amidase domain
MPSYSQALHTRIVTKDDDGMTSGGATVVKVFVHLVQRHCWLERVLPAAAAIVVVVVETSFRRRMDRDSNRRHTDQSVSQSVNQSVSQSVSQPASQSVGQLVSQSVSQFCGSSCLFVPIDRVGGVGVVGVGG